MLVEAADFSAINISIANDACGYDAKVAAQSQALQAHADRATFSNTRLLGAQDTIFADGGHGRGWRQYFRDSYINGSCDAIYGTSTIVFERCDIAMSFTYTAQRAELDSRGVDTAYRAITLRSPCSLFPPCCVLEQEILRVCMTKMYLWPR